MLELDEKDLPPFKVDVGHNMDQSSLLLLIFYTPHTKGLFLMFGLAGCCMSTLRVKLWQVMFSIMPESTQPPSTVR